MKITKVCILDKIINEADKHEQKDITCSRCKGKKKIECYKEIQMGVCYKCGGSGVMPNKWKEAKQEANQIKTAKSELRVQYKEKYETTRSEERKQDVLEMYHIQMNNLKDRAYHLANKLNIK
ncbi:hypothetical protein [Klebsiella phage 05F01]|nr:hypothetical protein [Klebsiella phage 05F01]